MKTKYLPFLLAALALLAVSCNKTKSGSLAEAIKTGWHLQTVDGSAVADPDVWVTFAGSPIFVSDREAFSLFQGSPGKRYYRYTGLWEIDEKKAELSGTYSDGTPWASRYKVAINGKTLTLTAIPSGEVSVYKNEAIPEEVTSNARSKDLEDGGPF